MSNATPRRSLLAAKRIANLPRNRLSAKSYVQDGLVAMWDGIENAGWGIHDANAATWADLTGNGYDATVRVGTWDSDGLNAGDTASVSMAWAVSRKGFAWAGIAYIEFVVSNFHLKKWGAICYLGGFNRCPIFNKEYDRLEPSCGKLPYYNYGISSSNGTANGAFAIDYTNSLAWHDGATMTVNEGSAYSIYPSNFAISDYARDGSNSNYLTGGKICRLAAYSRPLTADERAANNSIDKARFNLP